MASLDFMEGISSIPTVLLPFAIVFYFYNANNLKWMQERKELAEAVLNERKEWMQERREMLDRQFDAMDRLSTELANTRGENHALRNKLAEFLLRLDNHFFGRTGRGNGQ